MDPTITATVIGVLLTGVCGAFAVAVRWLRSDIHDLRSDMNDLRTDMNDLHTEVNDRFTAVEMRITTEIDKLETKVETKIDALGSKLDGLIMALANSGSLTYPPETTLRTAQSIPTETTASQSPISETAV